MDQSAAAAQDAEEVLRQALAGEPDAVAGAFDRVLHQTGPAGAYDVAWRLAATTLGLHLPTGAWTLDFPDIDQAAYETRWVARFLSAYANADRPTSAALFHAAQADGHLTECLLTLAGSAAATVRRRAR